MTGHRAVSAGRRIVHPGKPAAMEGYMTIVGSVLDKLADEIAGDGVAAFTAVLEQAGLRSDLGKVDALRAIRQFVIENLYDALRERVAEIEAQPDAVARLKVSSTRETIIELLAEYRR
jgi:hypothetical protein